MAASDPSTSARSGTWIQRSLEAVERLGNKLPDPALLFVWGMFGVWILSKFLSSVAWLEVDPRTIKPETPLGLPVVIEDQLTGPALASFLARLVKTFTDFHPLGVVLVALMGIGIAEHSGFIRACLVALLRVTPRALLTPMLILVGLLSHTAADAGYVLVIPMGGVLFHAAGRHPLAGIAAAFAGVSGGFSASPMVTALDPMLAGITQAGAGVLDTGYVVSPLSNFYFTASSSLVIVLLGWFLTDRVLEPRLRGVPVDGDPDQIPKFAPMTAPESRGMWCGLGAMVSCVAGLVLWAWFPDSALRSPDAERSLIKSGPSGAPLMSAIVPLILILFALPGIVHGYVSGAFKSHRDVIEGMSKSMGTMAYYLVLVFFASAFIDLFNRSNLGALLALKGAAFLKDLGAGSGVLVLGIISISGAINLLVGSASAKWALLAPILVPMSMSLGVSPELTQASYRIGDSVSNIITPMMPYFPLVVVFCRRYTTHSGIGTVISLMLPYSIGLGVCWTAYLFGYWAFGLPLGPGVGYEYVR